MNRRVGEPPQNDRRYTVRQGAYAILERDGAVLLTCQFSPRPDFQLPGGGVDPGESPMQALHREVFEETGWHIARPRRLGMFRRYVYMPEYDLWAEKLCQVYTARPTICLGDPSEPHHKVFWMTPQRAKNAVGSDGDRLFLTRYFGLLGPRYSKRIPDTSSGNV